MRKMLYVRFSGDFHMSQGQGIQKATISIVTPALGCLSSAKLIPQGINRTNPGDIISPETKERFWN